MGTRVQGILFRRTVIGFFTDELEGRGVLTDQFEGKKIFTFEWAGRESH